MRQANHSHRRVCLYFWNLLCVDIFTCHACSNMVNVCKIFAFEGPRKIIILYKTTLKLRDLPLQQQCCWWTRSSWMWFWVGSFETSEKNDPVTQSHIPLHWISVFIFLVPTWAEFWWMTYLYKHIFPFVKVFSCLQSLSRYRWTQLLHL
jgi:hypothetical protein